MLFRRQEVRSKGSETDGSIYMYVYIIDSPPPVARSYNSILDPAVFMLSAAFTDPCRIKKGNATGNMAYTLTLW